jgi:hypothetical protein
MPPLLNAIVQDFEANANKHGGRPGGSDQGEDQYLNVPTAPV